MAPRLPLHPPTPARPSAHRGRRRGGWPRRGWRCLVAGVVSLGLLGAAPPGYEQVRAGDEAWEEPDRERAREHWRTAVEADHPAVASMGALRLLQVSGTPGLAVQWVRVELWLDGCPRTDPWCVLAQVDRQLFQARVGLLHNRKQALTALAELEQSPLLAGDPELREAVAQRRGWLGTTDQPGAPPRVGPGTWTLALAPLGSTGLGGGAAVGFTHPDLGLRGGRLSISVGGTTRGNLRGGIAYNAPGRRWWHFATRASRYERVLLVTGDEASRESWRTLTAEIGPGLRRPWGSIWAGPALLHDAGKNSQSQTSAGLESSGWVRWGFSRSNLRFIAATGDYRLATGIGQVALAPSRRWGVVRVSVAPTAASEEAPAWRVPGWGGGVVLKHGSWQALRSPFLAGLSAELRTPKVGRFQGAVYGETAVGDRPVVGGGAGLMVGLPPSPQNPFRIDVAWGTLGLGISTGWGRVF